MNFKTPKMRIIINHLSFNTLLTHYTIRKKTYYRYFLTRCFLSTLTKNVLFIIVNICFEKPGQFISFDCP